ncbi:MAG: RagB/SusD family nutrient uptake outer membrane protein [Cyclobacteriaceae bacterium]
MNIKNKLLRKGQGIAMIFCFLFLGCENFLEEKPYSFLAPENFYNDEKDALSALVGAYAGLGVGSNNFLARRLHYLTWFPSDEAYPPTLAPQRQLDDFTFASDHVDVNQTWTQMYDAINRSNVVIGRVANIEMDESLKQQYIAEAQFIRALCYFYGVRLWGAIPLITDEVTSVEQVSNATRDSEDLVYGQIISDLESAAQYLPAENQDGRASLGAAKGLLAKVFLTRASSVAGSSEDYQRCADLAKEVIDSPNHQLVSNYQNAIGVANKFNPESLFELQGDRVLIPLGMHTIFGQFTIPRDIIGLVPEEGQTGNSDIVSEINYFNLYDDRDYRKESTFVTEGVNRQGEHVTWESFTFPYPHPAWKYVDQTSSSRNGYAFSANFVVLRLADVYLMRAEALNEINGPSAEAYEMINAIRERARNRDGVTPSTYPENLEGLSQDEFRDAVLMERAIELGFEGHRWFDLVRTGRLLETIRSINPSSAIAEKHYLFPIPADELIINENLTQNPGW